jgi:hypothetical protein
MGFPIDFLSADVRSKTSSARFSLTCDIAFPLNPPRSDRYNNIWLRAQFMKLSIATSNIPLRSLVLRHSVYARPLMY